MFSKSFTVSVLVILMVASLAVAPEEPPPPTTDLRPGGDLIELNDDNWRFVLRGEWMIGFFAPGCEACEDVAGRWERFAHRSTVSGVLHVAKVDVTISPWVAGRFYVLSVPKFYHVKDGEFREYHGPLYEDALLHFVKKELWQDTEPVSAWLKPNSIPMTLMGFCAKLSHFLTDIKMRLHRHLGISKLVAYGMVALGIMFGANALIRFCVFLSDVVNGPPQSRRIHKIPPEVREHMEYIAEYIAKEQDSEEEEQDTDTEEEDSEVEDQDTEGEEDTDAEYQDTEAEEHYSDVENNSSDVENILSDVENNSSDVEENYNKKLNLKEEKLPYKDKKEKMPYEDKKEKKDKKQDYNKEKLKNKDGKEVKQLKECEYQVLESSSWEDITDFEPEVKRVCYSKSKKQKKTKKAKQTKTKTPTTRGHTA